MVKRFEVYVTNLNPTIGREMKKIRPCVVISPNAMHVMGMCIIAPLTKTLRQFPFRVRTKFQRTDGDIALDQIKSIDNSRLIKKLGTIDNKTQEAVISILQEMFA
jgi:mRNA interferase MazF